MLKDNTISMRIVQNKLIRSLLLICGFLFTFLALLGAILPLIPTTPFLIVASACFYRSSPRFYNWMMNNRYFGKYLRDYREGKGIRPGVKIAALTFLWLSSVISVLFFVPFLWLKILIISMAAGVTVHIRMIKTKKRD